MKALYRYLEEESKVRITSGNLFGAIPIGHSVYFKEKHEHIKIVLNLLRYSGHIWVIFVELKMVNCLLGQQEGYKKYLCFRCL